MHASCANYGFYGFSLRYTSLIHMIEKLSSQNCACWWSSTIIYYDIYENRSGPVYILMWHFRVLSIFRWAMEIRLGWHWATFEQLLVPKWIPLSIYVFKSMFLTLVWCHSNISCILRFDGMWQINTHTVKANWVHGQPTDATTRDSVNRKLMENTCLIVHRCVDHKSMLYYTVR